MPCSVERYLEKKEQVLNITANTYFKQICSQEFPFGFPCSSFTFRSSVIKLYSYIIVLVQAAAHYQQTKLNCILLHKASVLILLSTRQTPL